MATQDQHQVAPAVVLAPVVMGIPARAASAEGLARSLGCPVNWDPAMRGPWANAREAWLSCPEGATHRLLLNDDAILCPGFREAAEAAIAAHPGEIISFFTTRTELLEAKAKGAPWITYSKAICGVALVLPRPLIAEFVAWADAYCRPAWPSADARLFLWATVTGRTVWYTSPSLVQHDESHTSTIRGDSNRGRISPYFAADGAAGVDWTGAPLVYTKGPSPAYLESKRHWFRPGVVIGPDGAVTRPGPPEEGPDIELAPIVMTHPQRLGAGMELAEGLGVPANVDWDRKGPWHNARQCWLTSPFGATHRLVIQDDAIPCEGFLDAARRAIKAKPEAILCFYTGRADMTRAAEVDGCSWLALDTLIWGLGLCMPVAWAREFVAWADANIDPAWIADDMRVLLWALVKGRPIYCTVPSLLQHDQGVESIVIPGQMNEGTAAHWTPDATALDFKGGIEYRPGGRKNFVCSRAHKFKSYTQGQAFEPWLASLGFVDADPNV